MTTIDFSQELDAIGGYLKAAQDILKSGFMPDITNLEKRVAIVCEALQNASSEIRKIYVARLSDTLKQIDDFEAEMRAFQESRVKRAAGNA